MAQKNRKALEEGAGNAKFLCDFFYNPEHLVMLLVVKQNKLH
jgi:hypothetical protein